MVRFDHGRKTGRSSAYIPLRHECTAIISTTFVQLDSTVLRNSEGNAVCLAVTQIVVHLIKYEWPQKWPSMVPELTRLGEVGVRRISGSTA